MLDFPNGIEAKEGQVEMDLPSGAVKEMLHFIYCGVTGEKFDKYVLEILQGNVSSCKELKFLFSIQVMLSFTGY